MEANPNPLHPNRIPLSEYATATDAKFVAYTLNLEHADGKHKAVMFGSIGFTQENWEDLRDAILAGVPYVPGTFKGHKEKWGESWEAIIPVQAPRGLADVVTGWMKPANAPPYLATARPNRRRLRL